MRQTSHGPGSFACVLSSLQQNGRHMPAVIMKIADQALLCLGASQQQLDLHIAFEEIDRADQRLQGGPGQGAAPQVNFPAVARAGSLEIAIVQGVDDGGVTRVCGAFGAVDYDL